MRIHIVQKGETLETIAERYHVELSDLMKLNTQLKNPENLLPGMKVRVPTKSSTVKKEVEVRDEKERIEKREEQKDSPSAEQTFKPFVPPMYPGGQIFPKPPTQPSQHEGFIQHPFKPVLPKESLPDLSSKKSAIENIAANEKEMPVPPAKLSPAHEQADASGQIGVPPYQMPAIMPPQFHHPPHALSHYTPYPLYPGPLYPMSPYHMPNMQPFFGPGVSDSSTQPANQYGYDAPYTGLSENQDDDSQPLTPVQGSHDHAGWSQQAPDPFLYPYSAPGMSGPAVSPSMQEQSFPMGAGVPGGQTGMMANVAHGPQGGQYPGFSMDPATFGHSGWNAGNHGMMPPASFPQHMFPPGIMPWQQQMMLMNVQMKKDCGCSGKPMFPQGPYPFQPFPYQLMPVPGYDPGGPQMTGNPALEPMRFDDSENLPFPFDEAASSFGEFPPPSSLEADESDDDSK